MQLSGKGRDRKRLKGGEGKGEEEGKWRRGEGRGEEQWALVGLIPSKPPSLSTEC